MAQTPSQWRRPPRDPSRFQLLFSFVPRRLSTLFQPHHHLPRSSPKRLLSPSNLFLLLVITPWFLLLHHSERSTFATHLSRCSWSRWESWPENSNPHHLILLADPQLVDAHTYPDRPWPLSSLTVFYTDLYLRRAFRDLLRVLEPDSVLFLGDLFDGGREWATLGGRSESPEKRYRVYGAGYWMREYRRFGRIFFDQWTKYVSISTSSLHSRDAVSKDDDAQEERDEQSSQGKSIGKADGDAKNKNKMNSPRRARNLKNKMKKKKIVATLPGNHDLGLGQGIQLPVRDRFHAFFGEGNRVDVLGNHTFVGIDAVSLSAKGPQQFSGVGAGSPGGEQRQSHSQGGRGGRGPEEVWKPTVEFLDQVRDQKRRVMKRELTMLRWRTRDGEDEEDEKGKRGGREGWGGKRWKRTVGELATSTDELVASNEIEGRRGEMVEEGEFPTVLLTHIPLYREPGTKCGPLREKWPPSSFSSSSTSTTTPKLSKESSPKGNKGDQDGGNQEDDDEDWKGWDDTKDDRNAIAVRAGYQYQNVLTLETSQEVVEKIGNVQRVFSGDDHDYCDVLHRRYSSSSSLVSNEGDRGEGEKEQGMTIKKKRGGIREITVKSMSWAMGIRKPGFVMVSLWNPVDSHGRSIGDANRTKKTETMQTRLCLLPDQLAIFIRYGIMFGVTIVAVLLRSIWCVWRSRREGKYVGGGGEDDDCDGEDEIEDEEHRFLEKNGVNFPNAAVSRRPRRSTLQRASKNGGAGGYDGQLIHHQLAPGIDSTYTSQVSSDWQTRDATGGASKKGRWPGRGRPRGPGSVLPSSISSSSFVIFVLDRIDGFVIPVMQDTLGTLALVAGIVGAWYLWLIWIG